MSGGKILTKIRESKLIKALLSAAGMLLLLTAFDLFLTSGNNVSDDAISINENCSVMINNTLYSDVTLSRFSFPIVNRGDKIVIMYVLPDYDIGQAELTFLSYHCAVKVYVGSEMLYQYKEPYYSSRRLIGSGYHFIQLPDDYAGQRLLIELEVVADNAFTSLEPVTIQVSGNSFRALICNNRLDFLITIFLMVFGAVVVVFATFAVFYNKSFSRLLWFGAFSLTIGLWLCTNYKFMQLFTNNLQVNTEMEYISLYALPIMALGFFHGYASEAKWERVIFDVLEGYFTAFFLTTLVLNYTGVAAFHRLLVTFHISLSIGIVFVVWLAILHLKRNRREDKHVLIAIIVITLFAGVDMVRYNLQKYLDPTGVRTNSYLATGAFALVLIALASYISYIFDHLYEEAEKGFLTRLAYSDALTNICNRAKCEEEMQKVETENRRFSIISFDINNLKEINDSLGHPAGDRLLKDFARLLAKCFAGRNTVGRMGGDEFIVILPHTDMNEIEQRIKALVKGMDNQNTREGNVKISASWGIAASTEVKRGKASATYKLADDRMYEMKRKYKAENPAAEESPSSAEAEVEDTQNK